jgi:hypothetical protein
MHEFSVDILSLQTGAFAGNGALSNVIPWQRNSML